MFIFSSFISTNYWAPLANQVEELDPPESINSITSTNRKRVRFRLPPNHIERDSTAYRQHRMQLQDDRTVLHPSYKAKITRLEQLRKGILDGTIPSAVSDTGATSHALLPTAPSIPTGKRSTVIFHLPNGATAPATTIHKLHHNVREPARSANIVPELATNSLMSTSKFVDAGYTVVYDDKEVNYYEKATTKIIVSEEAVQHDARSTWFARHTTGEPDHKHDVQGKAIPRLRRNTSRCNRHLPGQQHGPGSTQ